MTFSPLFKNSLAAAVLSGSLLMMPVAALAQYAPPANQNGTPAGENNGQYTSPPAPAADPNGGQYGADGAQNEQYGTQQVANPSMQNDAPSGIEQAPPAIPDYQQPAAPGDGYIWTPGYWAWGQDGYEWVDGAWVNAPYTGALWTPGYWGYGGGGYFWNAGYWGPTVGYYGGINYGFGYFGIGFYGGYWGGGRFWYNRAYCNVGFGRGFGVYNRPFNGYSGRPGGASFVRANGFGGNHGGGSFAAGRGSAINGNVHSSGFNQAANHGGNFAAGNSAGRSYSGGGNYSGASRTAAPQAQSHANYGGGSAPSNGGGGFHGSAPAGGGFHGGGGGGHR